MPGMGRSERFQFHDLWTAVAVNANGVHHRPFDTARWNWRLLATGYCFSCPALNKFT